MKVEYVALLETQRELYRIPRGPERFETYVRLMRDDARAVPLVALNPMARGHVAELVDALIGLDAERVGAEAAGDASARLADVPGDFRIGLVVADDVGGGWTNRYASEYAWVSGTPTPAGAGWLAGVVWSSEPASAEAVREAALVPLYRAAHVHRHGPARTLCDFMNQEGYAMAAAGCTGPTLDAEDLDYTRQLLEPRMGDSLPRTVMECLYGDPAGRTLGFTPRGLSHRAGLALALHQGRLGLSPVSGSLVS